MIDNQRPPIPPAIKREVRQRCGFGCVICGLPLYEYDHMEEWAVVRRHVAEEITLLCNQHHAEKTKGLLTTEKVREANDNPYNLQKGISKPYLFHFYGDKATMKIGSNRFTSQEDEHGPGIGVMPLVIDRFPFIGLRIFEELLVLDLQLYDQNHRKIIQIKENELIYDVDLYDVEFIQSTLTLRTKKGEIVLKIEFKPPHTVIVQRAEIYLNGVYVKITRKEIKIVNNNFRIRECNFSNIPYGIVIGDFEKLQQVSDRDIGAHITFEESKRLPHPSVIGKNNRTK